MIVGKTPVRKKNQEKERRKKMGEMFDKMKEVRTYLSHNLPSHQLSVSQLAM